MMTLDAQEIAITGTDSEFETKKQRLDLAV